MKELHLTSLLRFAAYLVSNKQQYCELKELRIFVVEILLLAVISAGFLIFKRRKHNTIKRLQNGKAKRKTKPQQ